MHKPTDDGLTTEDRLIMAGMLDAGETLNAFGAADLIWVPPEVTVASLQSWTVRWPNPTPMLVYPAPESWQEPVTDVDFASLRSLGWKFRRDTQGLLNDFLRLAKDDERPERWNQVRGFAAKWGPLWTCRAPDHWDCHWRRGGHRNWSNEPCSWVPQEEAEEFVRKAWQAKAVLEAATYLREGRAVPIDLRRILQIPDSDQFNLADQRRALGQFVNEYLLFLRGPELWMRWEKDSPQPKLELVAGLGFIWGVWIEVAQLLCHAKGIYQCDGCATFYVRQGRRPQAGRRNYCPECGTKAAKRDWWHRQQGKSSREPPVLHPPVDGNPDGNQGEIRWDSMA